MTKCHLILKIYARPGRLSLNLRQRQHHSIMPATSSPFFRGSYLAYRKIDVLRVVEITKTISSNPRYLDVGCGYGDFLKRIRRLLPPRKELKRRPGIFYGLGFIKPDYIRVADAHWI